MQLHRCRVWLPHHLCHMEPCGLGLAGWVNWRRQCLDTVVVAACSLELLSPRHELQSGLDDLSTLLPDGLKGQKPVLLGEILGPSSKCVSNNGQHERHPVWVEVVVAPEQRGNQLFPVLRRLQINGAFCDPDAHIIIYNQPQLGIHHFCSRPWKNEKTVLDIGARRAARFS